MSWLVGEGADQAAAFAAAEAIMEGRWDRYLNRVRGAIILRTQTDDYQATLIAAVPATPEATTGDNDE